MEIKLYLKMLQRGWWLVALTTLIAMITSLVISYLTTSLYQATARFIITPNASVGLGPALVDSLDTLENRTIVTTYAEIMNSRRITTDALTALQLPSSVWIDYISLAVVLPDTSILELSVTGPDPVIATNLANSIGIETINFTERINQAYDLNFLDTAVIPDDPISPQPLRDLALALALGLVGGAILAILSEQIRIPLEAYRQRFRMDRVTGLYNRKFILRLIEEEIAKDRNSVFSIGILELHHLNDLLITISNATLQRILMRVTNTLRKEFRGNDILGRWNDISFIIVMPSTSADSASRIFERVLQSLPVDMEEFGFDVVLEPHIGGAEYSNNITPQELVEKAESALEEARRETTRPIHIWSIRSPFWIDSNST